MGAVWWKFIPFVDLVKYKNSGGYGGSNGVDEAGMAYTRIHAIKTTVQKVLKNICNPEKTDGQILIDSFACGVETAHYDFMDALSKSFGMSDKQAFHLIQSFAPGEVDFNMAHQVGIELADKLLENKCSYVIAMHIDKDHVHNHIIFCAVDNVEHKKYNNCKHTYRRIRNFICRMLSREYAVKGNFWR